MEKLKQYNVLHKFDNNKYLGTNTWRFLLSLMFSPVLAISIILLRTFHATSARTRIKLRQYLSYTISTRGKHANKKV